MQDHLIKVRELVRESESLINKEQLTIGKVKHTPIPTGDENDPNTKERLKAYIEKRSQKPAAVNTRKESNDTGELTGKGSFFDSLES